MSCTGTDNPTVLPAFYDTSGNSEKFFSIAPSTFISHGRILKDIRRCSEVFKTLINSHFKCGDRRDHSAGDKSVEQCQGLDTPVLHIPDLQYLLESFQSTSIFPCFRKTSLLMQGNAKTIGIFPELDYG